MKKKITISLIILAVIVAGIAIYFIQKPKEPETIKIGAILPLTGPLAFMGTPVKNGMELAKEMINEELLKEGKNYRFEIIIEDSKGDPKTGVTNLQHLLVTHNPKIITAFLTGVCLAIKPIAEKEKILFFAQTVSPVIAKDRNYTFRFHYSFKEEGKKIAEYLNKKIMKKEIKTIGFIYSNDPSTTYEVEEIIIQNLLLENRKILKESFHVGEKDFKGIVSKIKTHSLDAIGVFGYGPDVRSILKVLAELRVNEDKIIFGNLGFIEIDKVPYEIVKNAIFALPPFLISSHKDQKILQFENKYKARWGEIQSYSAYYAYDLMYFIRDIIEKNGGKLDKSENIIKIINNGVFNLMTGSYSFKDGDAHPAVALGKYSKEMKLEEILNE